MDIYINKKFEYQIYNFNGISIKGIERCLNEIGNLGWELISITTDNNYIFKRELIKN